MLENVVRLRPSDSDQELLKQSTYPQVFLVLIYTQHKKPFVHNSEL